MRLLEDAISVLPGAIVAFSGGADSAFVAETTHRALGERSMAVTADSPSLARRELAAARDLAVERGWNHTVVSTYELDDERYASNPTDRCYWCKTALFDRLQPISASTGWPVLLGTNTDDLGDWRPGGRASSERGGLTPLVDAGFSKAEVREASRLIGLATADKPASACLASRFAYGVRVTHEGLLRVESAESSLHSRGFDVVRVRDLGDDRARVEVGFDEVAFLLEQSESVVREIRGLGFTDVTIDERGYRQGSLNEMVLLPKTIGAK